MSASGDYKDRVVGYIDRKARQMRRRIDDELNDDEFEVLEIADGPWMRRLMRDITSGSTTKQLAVGGASGWCTGYLFGKVGKAAAVALGGSLLMLQIAHHRGYITINWGKLEKNLRNAKRQIEQDANRRLPAIFEEVKDFAVENAFLAGGFAGGFLIGLAT